MFVADCQGFELLCQAGLSVTELPELAAEAAAPNRHLAW
jgi:diaminohydroxyphosphoribosylaminopyrimidine deaminase/5-amino-6-(5-phosphoribosylamino)uracil reductase